MASITPVIMTDDLDGSKAAETVAFALDGSKYEIDLSQGHSSGSVSPS
ncbi:hypothetical protein GIS00_24680 [Nakamurella sp. YIM 132087]|uniref:Lsr2 dimerization domain-containing protein n=1 Tax=Nakamurella alba TaxID=2665158 RepID=A0A7K1FSK7_9ACTN|nr:histone-like nucleoid-structuring protein Lsr2 [Nakamurella alba]MTD17135.1 hypothetical protein [Nakamurella alba]